MKTRKMLVLFLALLMMVMVLPVSVLAVPAATTFYDVLPENFVTDSNAHLLNSGEYAIDILNKPGTTFVLSHDYTSEVCDLWNEVDSEGSGELKFDQSFSININDAIEVYNNYIDTTYPDGDREHYKALEDNYNGSIFRVKARVLINDYAFDFSSRASYEYAPYGLDGEYNEGCSEWNISSYYNDLSDFLTMSKDGGILNLSFDGTVKEIYEALKSQDETLGDVTINNLEFQLLVSCEVEYRGSWGSINYTEIGFDGLSHTLYDKHIYESASENDILNAIPTSSPIIANVVPAFEESYVPVKTEYNWYYDFVKEGYDNEDDGIWYGGYERDETKESDVMTVTGPTGNIFGFAYGKVDSDSNSITLDDILNEDNKAFINSFIGVKSMEFGGAGQISIVCVVTLTFEDGKQFELVIQKADYSSYFMLPCMHACSVCGLCTVTDKILPCNFDQMSYEIGNICYCEEPSVPEYEITLESENTVTIEATEIPVKVVVEKIEVEETPTHSFIINATDAVGLDNVVALYNVNIFDEEGYPYTLNQWYDEGEELTVTFTVGEENANAISEGSIKVYHVSANGDIEEVTDITVDGDKIYFTWSDFSPFILASVSESDSDSIEIQLGAKSADTNVRYVEIDGAVAVVEEKDNKYLVEIGEKNLIVEITEKTHDGNFVKSQYFYVDMAEKTAVKLSLDSFMHAYNTTAIRTENPMGIRFKSHILKAAKNEETQFVIDEYGFVIATKNYLGENELTLDTVKKVTGVAYNKHNNTDIVYNDDSDEQTVFTGVLINIPVERYKTDLVCKTYTKITVNGKQFTVYGEAVVGNVYDTAAALLQSNPDDTQLRKIIFDYEKTVGIPGGDLYPDE